MAYNLEEATRYLETGGLGEVYGLADMSRQLGQDRVQIDTDMAVALCRLAGKALEGRGSGAPAEVDGVIKRGTLLLIGGDTRCPYIAGEIYGDRKGRFVDGERIKTSTITAIPDGVYRTRYSTYRVEFAEKKEAA
jgi:hypothetical protein